MTSAFDPDMFMNQQTEEASSTSFTPVPEGEFKAVVKEVKARTAGDKPILDVIWTIDDEGVKAETGLEAPTVRQTIWLDLTEQGGLDMGKGKNVGLGRLREALGQNAPGRPWAPGMLSGQVAMVTVKHRSGQTPGEVFADVKGVSAF